ncbi:hypothetical protein [Sorangium sp. So ce406]|uniref:hypothetical protein n=1 Tax=Sorangium sp. So ce406 TaxID=3133311 RepID=UPI003F5AF7A5
MLRFPRALWIALALAILLPLPSLFAELYTDDQMMVLRLEGTVPSPVPGPFHLYTFADGSAEQRAQLHGGGTFPWWTLPELRLSFFRPLSSGLLALDHALAGRDPLLYHVHSMAWYAAAVLAAALLFRRLLPERTAAAAALMFTIAPAHWMAAGWPSSRHVAIVGALGFGALALHLRARERGDRRAAAGALACAAIALLAGEAALGVFAYVFAYELLGRDEPLARRARAFAPWVALALVYAIAYKALHFGAYGSGGYLDPIAEASTFLPALPVRLAVFAEAALIGVPAEVSALDPRAARVLAALGVLALLAFSLLLRRALRRIAPEHARTLRWLLVGAALALLPGAAGIPGDRVLFLPNLGIVAALATVLLHAGRAPEERALAAAPARAGVALFGLLHVVLAAPVFLFGVLHLTITSRTAMDVLARADLPRREGTRVLGIGLSDPLVGMYLASGLQLAFDPPPATVDLLSMAGHDHRVRRVDARTLEIAVDGRLLDGAFENVVRARRHPLRAGDVVPLGAWSVRVLADDAGQPTRFAVTFDRDLDDPSLAFLHWKDGGLRAVALPPIGGEVLLRHEPGPMGM